MKNSKHISIYDTTLRDGAQAEGVTFSPTSKIQIESSNLICTYATKSCTKNPKQMNVFKASNGDKSVKYFNQ